MQNKFLSNIDLQVLCSAKLSEEITEELSNKFSYNTDQCCQIELSLRMEMANMEINILMN